MWAVAAWNQVTALLARMLVVELAAAAACAVLDTAPVESLFLAPDTPSVLFGAGWLCGPVACGTAVLPPCTKVSLALFWCKIAVQTAEQFQKGCILGSVEGKAGGVSYCTSSWTGRQWVAVTESGAHISRLS